MNIKFYIFVGTKIQITLNMKKSIFGLLSGLIFITTFQLQAQTSGGPFGLGIIVGEPTGLNAKLWTAENTAFAATAAWSLSNDWMLINADFLRHSYSVFNVNKGSMPLYYGLGASLGLGTDFILGARVPVGISYIFADAPLDVFLEVAPVLMLIPDIDFELQGGVGIRYYF